MGRTFHIWQLKTILWWERYFPGELADSSLQGVILRLQYKVSRDLPEFCGISAYCVLFCNVLYNTSLSSCDMHLAYFHIIVTLCAWFFELVELLLRYSHVHGDRWLFKVPQVVAILSRAFIQGIYCTLGRLATRAFSSLVVRIFPGHGYV